MGAGLYRCHAETRGKGTKMAKVMVVLTKCYNFVLENKRSFSF
jgi:hypothetical protein